MKNAIFLWSILLMSSLGSCAQDFKKVSHEEVDKNKVQIAQDFATSYLNLSKKGEAYEFGDEATEEFKTQLTPEIQKRVYEGIKKQFGDFKSLEYVETYIQKSGTSSLIHRFKGDFGEKDKKLEVRVVLDKADKIAGFWIFPWSDMLK